MQGAVETIAVCTRLDEGLLAGVLLNGLDFVKLVLIHGYLLYLYLLLFFGSSLDTSLLLLQAGSLFRRRQCGHEFEVVDGLLSLLFELSLSYTFFDHVPDLPIICFNLFVYAL